MFLRWQNVQNFKRLLMFARLCKLTNSSFHTEVFKFYQYCWDSFLFFTGGYYLTTLYASLFYINSYQPRLAARQLSVEAQHSINQWHRRRTLHCNKSRRSLHRRTIRRQTAKRNLETETESKSESRRENDPENADVSVQQTENSAGAEWRRSENAECEQELEDQPQTTVQTDLQPARQQEVMTDEEEDRQSACTGTEWGKDDSDGGLKEDLRWPTLVPVNHTWGCFVKVFSLGHANSS